MTCYATRFSLIDTRAQLERVGLKASSGGNAVARGESEDCLCGWLEGDAAAAHYAMSCACPHGGFRPCERCDRNEPPQPAMVRNPRCPLHGSRSSDALTEEDRSLSAEMQSPGVPRFPKAAASSVSAHLDFKRANRGEWFVWCGGAWTEVFYLFLAEPLVRLCGGCGADVTDRFKADT